MAQRFLDADYTERCVVRDAAVRERVQTRNLRTRGRTLPGQRWDVLLDIMAADDALQARVIAHQVANAHTPFLLEMPQGAALSVAQTAATASAAVADTEIATAEVPVGRYVGFANHRKVYLVVGRSGGDTIIYPGLVAAVPATTMMLTAPSLYAVYDGSASFGVRGFGAAGRPFAALGLREYLE